MKRWIVVLVVVFAVVAVVGAGYLGTRSVQTESTPVPQAPLTVPVTRGDVQQTVTAPGKLVGIRQITLATDVGGRLAEINVRPGDYVQAGDVLARLEIADLERAVTEAELALRQAQLHLEELQEPANEAEIRRAQHAIDQAAAALSIAQIERSATLSDTLFTEALVDARDAVKDKRRWYEIRLREREEGKTESYWFIEQALEEYEDARAHLARVEQQAELQRERAQSGVSKAWQNYQEAQDALEKLLEGTSASDLEAAQLKVEAAVLALGKARAGLEAATLTAPFDGIVLEVKFNPGETIGAGSPLIVLADPRAVEGKVTVIEEDFPLIQPDQTVELFFDALPNATVVMARVARIVPQRIPGDRPLYPVYIALVDELPEGLAPGMTVDTSIVIASRSDVLQLPRALVRVRSDDTAEVKVWANGQTETRTVQVGLRGDVYVEILEGLREGEQVVGQ